MTTLDFCRKNIIFKRSSDITGPFKDEFYPFLRAPFAANDDIRVKRLVIFKSSSSMGTVAGQCILAKRIVCDPGDILFITQSDSDAGVWSKTRGREWLMGIPDIMRLLRREKYAQTQELWMFRGKFLAITGPGINSAQSVQVATTITDESHLDAYPPGRLVEFEKRLGGRWSRKAIHITTAPNKGKEVDQFFFEGQQDEFHFRCPDCDKLIWPLWKEDSEDKYNGHHIFSEHGDSIVVACPHCSGSFEDTPKSRYALVRDGDYVSQNPNAPINTRSFRWNVFCAHWITWKEMALEYEAAINSARLGNLKPHEDWIKKRLCQSYTPTLPNLGEQHGESNYALGQPWGVPDAIRILTADYQAGKRAEGSHLWALCTEWDAMGNSRRIAYRRLDTWAQLRAMQLELGVLDYQTKTKESPGRDSRVYVDCGYDDRTVFWQCSLYKWYAVQGSDLQQFHTITVDKGTPKERRVTIPMPYSQQERQNGNVGARQPDKLKSDLRGALPPGWCLKITMCNPQIYGHLHALQSGSTGRYFGIATDMPEEYTGGFPAFIPVVETDKRTNLQKIIWRKVKAFEHPWDCESMSLMGALRAGFYPLKKDEPQPEEKAA